MPERRPRLRPLDPRYTEGYKSFDSTDAAQGAQARIKPKPTDVGGVEGHRTSVEFEPYDKPKVTDRNHLAGIEIDDATLKEIHQQSGEPFYPKDYNQQPKPRK